MDRRRRRFGPARGGSASFYERRTDRLSVGETSRLHHRCVIEVVVCDVSSHGFKAECDERVEIGGSVSLDIPGIGPVDAQVRWQIGNRMGGLFLNPISLAECEWTAQRAGAETADAC